MIFVVFSMRSNVANPLHSYFNEPTLNLDTDVMINIEEFEGYKLGYFIAN